MTETRYKFLRLVDGQIKSWHGDAAWTVGEWQSVDGPVELCENGFHCSKRMSEAFSYVQGEIVAKVEVGGASKISADKEAWRCLRIVDARLWRKEDSVALAVFAAELVLDNFESKFPDDDRPRKAIDAAKAYLADPSESAESAARSARSAARSARSAAESAARSARSAARSAASAAESAASAAESAASAAESAAESAESAAARSAWSAAWLAAESAESAARSAWLAARSAAESAESAERAAAVGKILDWMESRFETLPSYVPDSES